MAFAFDYDLTVVGGTTAGETAAIAAAQSYARVAWVSSQLPTVDPFLLLREGSLTCKSQTGLASPDRQDWLAWMDVLRTAQSGMISGGKAQSYGVHCLQGPIAFITDEGHPQVQVGGWEGGNRTVRSRTYLLAMELDSLTPNIPGIDNPQVWQIAQLWEALHQSDEPWPQQIAILGCGPQAVELSQSLQRMGLSVLLLTDSNPLLPHEDPDIAGLLQRYLEGQGIRIDRHDLTNIQPNRSSTSSKDLCLTVGQHRYKSEALVVASESSGLATSILDPLNLCLNLRQTQPGLWVNRLLQTSVPSIYACGTLLGGYRLPSLAQYEARLAVQNALFDSKSSLKYHQVPYVIFSDPPLARVGLTERQARAFDPQVQVIRQTYNTCDRAFFEQAPTGLCKVLVQPDGTMLGAHLLGTCAPELIHWFALAIQQGAKLQDLCQLGFATPTFAEVIQQVVQQWQQDRWRKNRDRQERRFYRQRKRSS